MNHEATFDEQRNHLFGVAYRMLGSAMDAEDMVQETYLRWQRVNGDDVESPKAYLTSTITRLCIDHLRSARVKRETYVGPWLPEPLLTETMPDVEDMVALSESLSMAFMVLLEKLGPSERASFLLREVFDYDYAEIAPIVGKSEANCRQLVSRAKRHVQLGKPRFDVSREQQAQITFQFAEACATGDTESLINLLADDITTWADGGGKRNAALRPIHGIDKVVRGLIGIAKTLPQTLIPQFAIINAHPGLILYEDGQPYTALTLELSRQENGQIRIQNIHSIVNPDKLGNLPKLL